MSMGNSKAIAALSASKYQSSGTIPRGDSPPKKNKKKSGSNSSPKAKKNQIQIPKAD